MGFVEPTKFTLVTNRSTGVQTKRVSRDTKWKARYRDPNGRARSKTFDRKFDAEKFLARVDTDIQRDEWADPQRRRAGFDEWADAWFATTARLSASTRRGYEKTLRLYVRPEFGGRRIASIDWLEVELFVASLIERGLSPKTCRDAVSVLSLIMKTAQRAKVLRENPASGHSIPVRRRRAPILTMEQVHQLADAADPRYTPAIWLLVLAGLRPSELCGLRVCDIDWPRRTLTVNETQMWVKGEHVVKGPKTESGIRTIPIPEWLIDQLAASLSARTETTGVRPSGTDRMFVSPTGKPMYDHTLWRIVHNARVAADLPEFRPYDLRHTHASLLIDLDAHPKAISERMGHSEIGVTMNVYGHLFQDKQEKLTNDLDALVERTRQPGRPDSSTVAITRSK
jgi:integrase